ncbi:terpenoid synthase [Penicillium angulare]|uniref:terpenoid synthase n=1 Tax=Penicillium angulare TaxID=116970 RepID=UPI00253FF43E|nr:terpenoid synthase [Penicillium angulare]KAJ5281104.1 terpenoid synthase [Penicillium angulare]
MGWTFAKLAIGSRVDYEDPELKRFLHLLGDHILRLNDIALFDKELKRYKNGQSDNSVKTQGLMVLKDLLALPTIDAAKSVLYVYRLEYEKLIDLELESPQSIGLTKDEWYLLDTYITSAKGNTMAKATMARYGEPSRLPDQSVAVFNSRYFQPDKQSTFLGYAIMLGTAITATGAHMTFL